MASNEIPRNTDALISLAATAAEGTRTAGAAVPLAQNTHDKISADLTALIGDRGIRAPDAEPPVPGAQNTYNAAKAAKVAATAASRSAETTGLAFCAKATGVLKNFLGTQWNPAWNAAGFTAGSLAMPDDCLSLLSEIRACLKANPAYENAPLKVTAAESETRMDELIAARAASKASVQALGQARADLDAAVLVLRHRLSGLRAELDQLLEEDDPRWYAFGFDRPADGWQPGPVEHLILTPGAPGSIFADWDDTRRADRYRVTRQIGDASPETAHPGVLESEYTLQGLPSGAAVTITITALNAAGDSAHPATATLVVP
ncbi:MAG: fibronectin type III domain-containing protein [Verrucomicrobiota bacterium]